LYDEHGAFSLSLSLSRCVWIMTVVATHLYSSTLDGHVAIIGFLVLLMRQSPLFCVCACVCSVKKENRNRTKDPSLSLEAVLGGSCDDFLLRSVHTYDRRTLIG
jgi:hypothetical protein